VGSATLQPVMPAAVDLEQHPLPGIAVPPLPMPGWPPVANTGHAGNRQDAVHGGAGEKDAVVLGEHLREVLPVEAGIGAGGQLDHPGRHGGVQRMPRPAPAVAVGQGRRSPRSVRGPEPAQLADGDAEELGRLRCDHDPHLEVVEDQKALLLGVAQGDRILHGRTKSQNS